VSKAISPARSVLRKFLVQVAAVHVVAIGLYYTLDVADWLDQRQRYFAWAWMAVTVGVVFSGLHKLKRARRGLS
jgi:hypothetical protein